MSILHGINMSLPSLKIQYMAVINGFCNMMTKLPRFCIHGGMWHERALVDVRAQRLLQGGARGFGIRSTCSGQPQHLHPEEKALICSVPPTFTFPMEPRAALCLLGKISAPLRVLWVQAHILAALQRQLWGHNPIDPCLCVKSFQEMLVGLAFHRWVTPQMYQPRHVWLQIEGTTHILEVTITQPTTILELIRAEKLLCGWGHYIIVKHQGTRLAPHLLLHPWFCLHH